MEENSTESTSSLKIGLLEEVKSLKLGCAAPFDSSSSDIWSIQPSDQGEIENVGCAAPFDSSSLVDIRSKQPSGCAAAFDSSSLDIWRIQPFDQDTDTAAERLIPCIYKIPDELRVQKESAYKPRFVSIGPIHSNNERLNANEPIKLSYTDSLCSRILGDETMELCRSAMKALEADVEKCYAENVKLIIDENKISLAEMMFIDGCFILELLYKYYSIEKKSLKRSIDDPVFSSLMKLLAIRHDLLLLENQIPFFVLEKLFSLTIEFIPDHPHNVSLMVCLVERFGEGFGKGNGNGR